METKLERLAAEALRMTASERGALAQLLIASLDHDSDLDKAWANEVELRMRDIEDGNAQTVPARDALAAIRAKMK